MDIQGMGNQLDWFEERQLAGMRASKRETSRAVRLRQPRQPDMLQGSQAPWS